MDMYKFPVKIDLSKFFGDERKFVIILADPNWNNVESLQQKVEKLFNLQPVHFLTSDGLFIPPQESIEVVQFTDAIKAFVPAAAMEQTKERSVKLTSVHKENIKVCGNDGTTLPVAKKLNKKRKCFTLDSDLDQRKCSKFTRAASFETQSCESSVVTTELNLDSAPNIVKPEQSKTLSATAADNSKLLKSRKHVESHIYFHESDQKFSTDENLEFDVLEKTGKCTKSVYQIYFECCLNKTAEIPTIFPLKSISLYRQSKKSQIHIQENIILPLDAGNIITARLKSNKEFETLNLKQAEQKELTSLMSSNPIECEFKEKSTYCNDKNIKDICNTVTIEDSQNINKYSKIDNQMKNKIYIENMNAKSATDKNLVIDLDDDEEVIDLSEGGNENQDCISQKMYSASEIDNVNTGL